MDKAKSRNRVHWLDVSRGLAFLMVIYTHLEFCNPDIMKYLSPVFLTTFFFVSGYLFKRGYSFSFVFEQRTRTLLLPTLLLGFIMILMEQIITFNEKVSFHEAIKGLLLQYGENQILWFVASLYIYSIFFYWIERFSKNSNQLLLYSSLLFILNEIYSLYDGSKIPWHIEYIGYACFYMGLGLYYKDNEEIINKYINNRFVFSLCIIIYVCFITLFDLRISFFGSKYIIDALIITTIGLFLMIYISKEILNNNRLLLFVGANTLFYFAFHGKCFSLLTFFCHKIIAQNILDIMWVNNIVALVIVLLDAIILIIPAIIVNRYFRFLLGRGFKLWYIKE